MKNISQIVEKDDMMKLIFDINQAMKPFKNEKEKNNWALIISPDGIIYEANSEMRGHPAIICNIIKPVDIFFKTLFEYFFSESDWEDVCRVSFFSTMFGYIHMDGNIEEGTVNIRYSSICISKDLKAFIQRIKEFFPTCNLVDLCDKKVAETYLITLSQKVAILKRAIEKLFGKYKISDRDINSLMNTMGMDKDEFFTRLESQYIGKPCER